MKSIVTFHVYNFFHNEVIFIVDNRILFHNNNKSTYLIIMIIIIIDNNCVLLQLLEFQNCSKTVSYLKIALSNYKIVKFFIQINA